MGSNITTAQSRAETDTAKENVHRRAGEKFIIKNSQRSVITNINQENA
jgi:hypothetical protein